MANILKRIDYKLAVFCYCAVLCIFIFLTSIPFGGFYNNADVEEMDFSSGWSVHTNTEPEIQIEELPYALKDSKAVDMEICNVIPETPFPVAVLETVIFQRDVEVYVDGILIMEKVFEQKIFNQSTPGSGRIFVPLPPDSAGKEVVVKYHKAVNGDNSRIAQIRILNGLMNERAIISLSTTAFVATVLMFFMGVCLLIASLSYTVSGVQIYSLSSMAMFVISTSMWVMCNSKVIQYFTDNWVMTHNLEYMAFYSTPLWLWLFVSYNWTGRKRIGSVVITALTVFFAVTLTAKAFGICDFFVFLRAFHVLAIINIVILLILGIKDYGQQAPAMKIFFLGIGCLCLTSSVDLIRYYTVFSPDTMAVFYIMGIIFMGFCLLLTFILMTKEKMRSAVQESIYKELAFSDILTGLYSRAKWETDVSEIQASIESYDSVLAGMIDVNDLKKVNDNFGHRAGDQMLITVSDAIKIRFEGFGYGYRLGGDEFCVIALNKSEWEMEHILSQIDNDLKEAKLPYPVSVAWGYVKYESTVHKGLDDAICEADNQMYEAKRRMKKANNNI